MKKRSFHILIVMGILVLFPGSFTNPKIIDNLASSLPNSQVIEMPGGHAPHIVSREKFLAELEKFQKISGNR